MKTREREMTTLCKEMNFQDDEKKVLNEEMRIRDREMIIPVK